MSGDASSAALASFEAKWTRPHPEFALALRFVAPAARTALSAFTCLVLEIEHLAFAPHEASVAASKLEWWAGEFERAARAEPQHPLTQVLAPLDAFAQAPWNAVIAGAMAQRDPAPAGNLSALLGVYARLYEPLAAAESLLFSDIDASATAQARSISRALRETAALASSMRTDVLALPLDLLARHQLDRVALGVAGAARDAAVREHLAALIAAFDLSAPHADGLSLVQVAAVTVDRARARSALHARQPLSVLDAGFARLPLATILAVWLAARRRAR